MTSPFPPVLFHGASWYPEQFSERIWREDMKLMNELGLNVVRLGEFSWSRLEPKEGDIQTDWLSRALDLLQEHGIRAIAGAPTAAPPQWLLLRHPEIGYVEPNGYRHGHGGRQHACYNNPRFREYSERISEALVRAVGAHPAIIGWQLDNEVRGHQKLCLCHACRGKWSAWLRERYGTIQQLNQEWGMEIWSNRCESFDTVPQPYLTCTWSHHHSLLISYRRFMSETAIEFLNEQAAVLRRHTSAPITHNSENSVDEGQLYRGLDFASADIYAHYMATEALCLRLDSLRNAKPGRRFWTMETGNEGYFQGVPQGPDWLPCFAFLNYASGSQAFLYWPWRQPRSGTEIDHQCLLYTCGRVTPGYLGAQRVEAMRRKLEPILADYEPEPAEVALIRSEWNGHYFFTDRVGGLEPNFSYGDHLAGQMEALVRVGAWRDVLFDEAALGPRQVIFSPYLPCASTAFLTAIRAHLQGGGVWVAGPYCGYRDRDHTVPREAILGDVEKIAGFRTRYFSPGKGAQITFPGGSTGEAKLYVTVFDPQPDDEILGTFSSGPFTGAAWGVRRQVEGGVVYAIGSELDAPAREALFARILDREGVARHPLPARVWMCPQRRAGGGRAWALANWDVVPHTITLPRPGKDLLTEQSHQASLEMAPGACAFVAF